MLICSFELMNETFKWERNLFFLFVPLTNGVALVCQYCSLPIRLLRASRSEGTIANLWELEFIPTCSHHMEIMHYCHRYAHLKHPLQVDRMKTEAQCGSN